MMLGYSLITLVIVSVLNNVFADGGGHHHHVIIHVPYKIHTIHHVKHVHHQKKEPEYEVVGYTVGKPIDLSHELGGHHHFEPHIPPPPAPSHHHEATSYHHHHHAEEAQHNDFNAGNELGYGHEWSPSYGHEFHGGGSHYDNHANFGGGGHEFGDHHDNFGGYD